MKCMDGKRIRQGNQSQGSVSSLIEGERKKVRKYKEVETIQGSRGCMFYAACHYPPCTRYTTRYHSMYVCGAFDIFRKGTAP